MKPVGEEAVETATISAPTKPQTEGPQPSTGEVNGLISPPEETPAAPQTVGQDAPQIPPNTPQGEPATTILPPQERPVSLQEEKLPKNPTSSSNMMQPNPQAEGEHQPCLPTNGFSVDSTDTSILSPSSLTDSDLLEAVLDGTSSLVPEKLIPKEPVDINVNVQLTESPLPDIDISVTESSKSNILGDGKGKTTNKISHSKDTVDLDMQECIGAKIANQDEVVSCKHSDPKSNKETLSGEIQAFDVPDGLESEDQPPVSEAEPPPHKLEPKKQQSLFKRNKRKSNQGNLSINLNKDVWHASLFTCLKGKSLFILFLLHFYILCIGYFSLCS